jgi:hypothetical protein
MDANAWVAVASIVSAGRTIAIGSIGAALGEGRALAQGLLGGHIYQSHDQTSAGQRLTCGHCSHPITGEVTTKKTKAGPNQYIDSRCVDCNKEDHPRIRVPEADINRQVLDVFATMWIDDEKVRDWFRLVLASPKG